MQPINHALSLYPVCEVRDADGHCLTCSDEATPVTVLSVGDDGYAEVLLDGILTSIDISLIDPVVPGDVILTHGGTALARLDNHT